MSNISGTVKAIQDIMRQDAGIDGDAQRIGQLTWLFFLKIFDDREYETELLDGDYRSPVPHELRWRTWATPREGITGDELLDFVNNRLFPTLKEFAESAAVGRASVIGNVFQDAFNYMKNGTLIRQVVNKINEIDFNRSEDRHLFGDIYEKILKDLQSAGNSGEYYTPRAITQFMVDMTTPRLGEDVLDPACGTGGFLICAIEHIRKNHVKTPEDEARLQATVRGVEKKQLPHLLCVTNMLLHGIDVPTNIKHDNTLSRPLRDYSNQDRVDVILSNPPFGGTEEPGIENNFPQAYRTRETADLFLVLIEQLLKVGGRAAVVLPDGTLAGDGVQARIKEKLLTSCNLHTVVRLPKGVFNPYASIATNLLFFTKGQPTTEIWYYEHNYPPGHKNYSKTKPIRIEEFEAEKAWWNNRVESEVSWKVSIEDIRGNWNLDIPNPHKVVVEHPEPDEVLNDYQVIQDSMGTTSNAISGELIAAAKDFLGVNQQVFARALRHIAETSEGLEKLRELLTFLAVRGVLTRRDAAEEPAAVFVERATLERAAWVAEGRIRKPKDLPPFAGKQNAPEGWVALRLGDLVTFEYGKNMPADKRIPGDVPVYGANGIVGTHTDALVEEACLVVGRKGSAGAVNRTAVPCWPTDVTYFVRPPAGMPLRFLEILLCSLDLPSMARGIKPGLDRNEAYALPILVPPLPEQWRIVHRIDELMELCDQLSVQQTALSEARMALTGAMIHRVRESVLKLHDELA